MKLTKKLFFLRGYCAPLSLTGIGRKKFLPFATMMVYSSLWIEGRTTGSSSPAVGSLTLTR